MYSVALYIRGLEESIQETADELYVKLQVLWLVSVFPIFAGIAASNSVLILMLILGWSVNVVVMIGGSAWFGIVAGALVWFSRRFEIVRDRQLKEVVLFFLKHPELRPVAEEILRLEPQLERYIRPFV